MEWNKNLLTDSIKALPTDGAQWFCPGHGEPFQKAAWDEFVKN